MCENTNAALGALQDTWKELTTAEYPRRVEWAMKNDAGNEEFKTLLELPVRAYELGLITGERLELLAKTILSRARTAFLCSSGCSCSVATAPFYSSIVDVFAPMVRPQTFISTLMLTTVCFGDDLPMQEEKPYLNDPGAHNIQVAIDAGSFDVPDERLEAFFRGLDESKDKDELYKWLEYLNFKFINGQLKCSEATGRCLVRCICKNSNTFEEAAVLHAMEVAFVVPKQ